ncbi:MAG: hypothetical protein IIW03_06015 [Clostridia bacterium]|nr:hypothetical protein [Clostridia bacterium]
MEDLSQKISQLLNSPDGMDKIRQAAASILGNEPKCEEKDQKSSDQSGGFSLPDGLLQNAQNMQGIMRIINLFQNRKDDNRIGLLLALKPHLSSERAARVDKAVSLLKVASLLPVLREEGLLESLGF